MRSAKSHVFCSVLTGGSLMFMSARQRADLRIPGTCLLLHERIHSCCLRRGAGECAGPGGTGPSPKMGSFCNDPRVEPRLCRWLRRQRRSASCGRHVQGGRCRPPMGGQRISIAPQRIAASRRCGGRSVWARAPAGNRHDLIRSRFIRLRPCSEPALAALRSAIKATRLSWSLEPIVVLALELFDW